MIPFPGPQEPSPPAGRTRHPYFMHDMIRRQAVAGRATLRAIGAALEATPEPVPSGGLLFTGLGTSFHAARAAARAAGLRLPQLRVRAADAFDVLDGGPGAPPERTAVVFSQSGATGLTIAAQRALRAQGTRVLLVTTEPESPSAREADRVLLTEHAREESWTHTVSFTTALVAAGRLLDAWTGTAAPSGTAEDGLGDAITAALASESAMIELAERFTGRDRYLLLGSGPGAAPAAEGALKLREAAGKFVATTGVEEFLHGPIPSIGDRTAVIALATDPDQRTRAAQGLAAAGIVGAETALFDASGGPAEERSVRLPAGPEPLAAALWAIPFQLLAYWVAVSDGRNPDVMGLDDPRYFRARASFGI
ncbi:MAG TPA: SIS domain-containing protein [Thermoplasmata archaeon]|nr:SIS domain-containing protein [Thermoplasmata archaeon]